MTEIDIADAAKLPTLLLASKAFEITTYHGGSCELHVILPQDMTHPAAGFLVVENPAYGWRNPSKCYRCDTLAEAWAEYSRDDDGGEAR